MRAITGARRQFLLGAITVVIIIVGVALIVAALAPGSDGSGIGNIFSGSSNSNDPSGPRIVVNGYGQASGAADSASIQIMIQSTANGYGSSGNQEFGTPASSVGTVQVAAAVPVVDALVAAGIPRGNIDVVVSPTFSSGSCFGSACQTPFRIDITLDQPSLDRVTNLINQAAQAANENNLRISDVGAAYTMSDCSTLQRQARQTAIDDAQKQAAQQAQLLHVRLSTIVEVSDVPSTSPSAGSGCTGPANPSFTSPSLSRNASSLTVPEFDPMTPTNAVAQVTVKLTYSVLSSS